MGIAPYKTFTFDGESSADYGVYITGEDVFNAPDRAVEMIEIPHRNGAYALDGGRFENISVTYKVGIVDDDETDFADRVSDFRNWLCSKVGYCRLEDEYNPDEYRMAVYKTGLNVDHDLLIAGEAEVTFDCKPQRWLKSGETATTITSGDALTNPTRFEAHPLLEVEGYGSIDIGGQGIGIENVDFGIIPIGSGSSGTSVTQTLDMSNMNTSDTIYVNNTQFVANYKTSHPDATITQLTANSVPSGVSWTSSGNNTSRTIVLTIDSVTFSSGTSNTVTKTVGTRVYVLRNGSTTTTAVDAVCKIAYDGDSEISYSVTFSAYPNNVTRSRSIIAPDVSGDSTVSALGHPLYIDLDLGEAYNTDSGTPVSVNNAVTLGADLPKLPTGSTTITYDNTITDLKVAARWWKV